MFELNFDSEKGVCLLGGEPMVLHCNHYNAFLQRTLLDPDYIDSRPILKECAAAVIFSQITEIYKHSPSLNYNNKIELAEHLFKYLGFGLLDFSEVTNEGGVIKSESSHFSHAWKHKFGQAREPMAFFDAGYSAGAISAALGQSLGKMTSEQESCIAQGSPTNTFKAHASDLHIDASPKKGTVHEVDIPPISIESNVDERAIVNALASMPIEGNDQGLIPAFGVVLTRMHANYYNGISYKFEKLLGEAVGDENLAKLLLIEAGHSCAFNTFGGIALSDEWVALIEPMCQSREDWLHGIIAVINALGWGVWRVHELIADKRLVVRIYNGYESNGYLSMYGVASSPKSYLATGGVQGIMNLIYHIDIRTRPELTQELYDKSFSSPGSFTGRQTKCRAMGDSYDEFIAERE